MDKLESLRMKLHSAIEKGDKEEIHSISRQLDEEILKYIRKEDEMIEKRRSYG